MMPRFRALAGLSMAALLLATVTPTLASAAPRHGHRAAQVRTATYHMPHTRSVPHRVHLTVRHHAHHLTRTAYITPRHRALHLGS